MVVSSWSILESAPPAVDSLPAPETMRTATDALSERARETVTRMIRGLPNFLCSEVVRRDAAGVHDVLSADVSYSASGGEEYRNVRVNGRPTEKPWTSVGGDVSTGEFGSMLQSVLLDPDADFQFVRDERIGNLTAAQYSFHISREHSDWKVRIDYQFIIPEYSGRIWIDRSSSHVVRIERQAEDIPPDFPLRRVDSEVSFGEVRMGTAEAYLLPLQAGTLVCTREPGQCSRKSIGFGDYRRFRTDSKIVF